MISAMRRRAPRSLVYFKHGGVDNDGVRCVTACTIHNSTRNGNGDGDGDDDDGFDVYLSRDAFVLALAHASSRIAHVIAAA